MICPSCGFVNLPGSDVCSRCMLALSPLDLPEGHDVVESSVLRDPISKLKPKPPVTVLVSQTLGHGVYLMREHQVGALMVVDAQGKLVGILTERDYVRKIVGKYDDFNRLPITDFMTTDLETLQPDDILAIALQKMDVGDYRHLPVVVDGAPVGLLSVRDIVRHITRLTIPGKALQM